MNISKDNIISQGAEAIIYRISNYILKIRIPKKYRDETLDISLRSKRTRREAKVLMKLSDLIFVPDLICYSDGKKLVGDIPEDFPEKYLNKSETWILMSFIDGKKIKDFISDKNYELLMNNIAKYVAEIHSNNIIHGDLTTSNMILHIGDKIDFSKVYFIDFGLSFFSDKIEDKAVDIHLLRRALESGHPEISEECFDIFKNSYSKNYSDSKQILKRLEDVEMRGRYKKKQ